MLKQSRLPYTVPAILFFFSLVTILLATVQAVQIPLGALPADNARISTTPVSHFIHVVGGAVFGLLGPLQFGRVLARKFGKLHRVLGRVFVVAGFMLSLSSLSLLWHFPNIDAPLASAGRLVFGSALGAALTVAILAIRKRDFIRHRDWMIRSYALGIGATAVSMVFIPIYVIKGVPPMGLVSDIAFIGSWAACVLFAELLVRRLHAKAQAAPA